MQTTIEILSDKKTLKSLLRSGECMRASTPSQQFFTRKKLQQSALKHSGMYDFTRGQLSLF